MAEFKAENSSTPLSKAINRHLSPNFQGFSIEYLSANQGVALLSPTWVGNNSFIEEKLEELRLTLETELSAFITIGVGTPKENFKELPNSFLEATAANDYRFVLGKNKVILFENLHVQEKAGFSYPVEQLDTLRHSILTSDLSLLHATIQELSGTIITQSSSLFTARTLSYDIVNTTLRSLNETFGAEVFTVEQFDIISLLTFDTLNDMKENLLLFTEKISKYISQDIKKPLHLLAIEYLKENYSSPYFSC